MTNTTLCYIEKDQKYLMLHRVKKINDLNKDKWIGIGGKLENCESPHDCIRREVKEESGLELCKIEYRGFVTCVDMTDEKNPYTEYMHLFWTDDFKGQLKICDEGDLEWVLKSKMKELSHWEGDEIFLDLIEKKAPFFSLKLVYKNGVLLESVLN